MPFLLAALWFACWLAASRGIISLDRGGAIVLGLSGFAFAVVAPRAASLTLLSTVALWLLPQHCVDTRVGEGTDSICYALGSDEYKLYLVAITCVVAGAALRLLGIQTRSRFIARVAK